MQRRYFLFSLIVLLALTGQGKTQPAERSRLIFHVNDAEPDHQESVLRNLHNHLGSMGPGNLDIKVLLHGQGITLLLLPKALDHVTGLTRANANTVFRHRIDALRAQGVRFMVSGASLAKHHIDYRHDLYGINAEDIVANGLAYLADLQRQGYTYIKP